MSYIEEDRVDGDATAQRGPDDRGVGGLDIALKHEIRPDLGEGA